MAWVTLRPSLLEAATNIEWCLESTYSKFLIKQTASTDSPYSLISRFFLNLRSVCYNSATSGRSQTDTFALDNFSPLHVISTFLRWKQRAGMSTDIYVDTSDERSAPGRVDYIGSQSCDEQPNVSSGKTLELKTRAGREHTTAPD